MIKGDDVNLLILRLESLDDVVGTAIQAFLGLENFKLTRANQASEKEYQDIYMAFKQELVLPDSYIDEMYTSKFAQHFYTPDEIATFRQRCTSFLIWRTKT